ncbi:DUF885 domain-containing protein [Ichthyenterobacterium magnum]|uniref:Uncharacterized protein DUF885 n=1 Tax=Ichthyenterobacterium magnum TaxID=1230530 RepID=A0A420DKW8_9FLAO|nr:DUF885 domain-containing protein [Ichthyenterobacterium magnum]RKE94807.1 uncharacterized protein DUF885 [Ichthyenterobacterium magnum]
MLYSKNIKNRLNKLIKTLVLIILLWNQVGYCYNGNALPKPFSEFRTSFIETYEKFQIAPLQLSYVSNFNAIKTYTELATQEGYFNYVSRELKRYNVLDFNDADMLDYQIMKYETELNLERIKLELDWLKNKEKLNEKKSLYYLPNGKKWYVYYLKKWVDASVNPEEIYQFGLNEIEDVKQKMKTIRNNSGMSDSKFNKYLKKPLFFLSDSNEIQKRYEQVRHQVDEKAKKYFPYVDDIPELKIEKGINENLAHVPAYYNNNIFYYNHFKDTYDTRQMGWTYIHEGIPGHHYQISVNTIIKRSVVQNLFRYYGFIEGWGAYVEQFGELLGAYPSYFDTYGLYEWDLIRSVRVALDVGINYYGWSDDKAMAFWKEHITDKDDIAKREIARMKRWPAQVITYKYGKKVLNKLKGNTVKSIELKAFHKEVLKHGDLPLSILKQQF